MNPKLFDLSGRVIVITGAAGLLGQQHANAVASVGGIPVLLDLKAEPIEKLAREKYRMAKPGEKVFKVTPDN